MITINKSYNPIGFLSGSTLKILACIFMAFDHVGVVFFPREEIFRMIGRIAFPLFAYFIAEGCKYTKNKLQRFLTVFIIGSLYVLFYYIYEGEIYCNIFITFSISIAAIFLLQLIKKLIFNDKKIGLAILTAIGLLLILVATTYLSSIVYLEYGFRGVILALLVSLFDFKGVNAPRWLARLDNHFTELILFTAGLLLLCINANQGELQFFSLIAVVLLLFYNGTVGSKKLKYAFYIFYPAHLLIIEGLSIVLTYL